MNPDPVPVTDGLPLGREPIDAVLICCGARNFRRGELAARL